MSAGYSVTTQYEHLSADQQSILWDSINKLETQDQAIIDGAARIADLVARTAEKVKAGQHINSLGELQSCGPSFDQACALRQAAIENLTRVAHLLGVDQKELFAKIYGSEA